MLAYALWANYRLFVPKTCHSQERKVPIENFRSPDFSWELHGWKLVRLVLMCTVYKNRFPKVPSSTQILFIIPYRAPRYSGLRSTEYQLDECKIWGNDSRQRNVPLSHHSSRSWKYRDFFVKTKTKTKTKTNAFISRPRSRPRPFSMSSRRL